MPKTLRKYVKRQTEQVIEAIEQAEASGWFHGAIVELEEKMSTQLCIDLLVHGLMVMGEGEYIYRICLGPDADVKKYLKKAKAEI